MVPTRILSTGRVHIHLGKLLQHVLALLGTGKAALGERVAGELLGDEAEAGEDIGITKIEGIVPLEIGKVTVLRLPGIQRCGSRQADLDKLKIVTGNRAMVGAIGVEALVALRKAGIEPCCIYGVRQAVVEAAQSGLSPVVVCVDDDTSDLIRMLEDKDVDYEIVDGRKTKR